ncbi:MULTISPECIES: MarR family winged helix-turn-helix transcriptional regulator [Fictibacillus]|jgi:DNA-binding MarR family transcriptional regulator|uniref:MarR family winged helix-turn-helix transcriptional regulator n=1 Tax=Fictibacillus TaxID=1329200 RepID=UPI0018CEAF77|nr:MULTISPECIES: MarR family transcriptional regulator [unclassified Fictibacillus]MBH0162514.1 MarR family transcriptional regulator [Fictibacillus sp. 26RED30]MBH0165278.1 MarR family transcriptional regulator [Fictibacillus sp. 7GRE50]MBH0172129.1 MarR family transcriptional regulator [Fictibacillus sp. 23RED33]
MGNKDLKSYVERLEKVHYIVSKRLHPEIAIEKELTKTQFVLLKTLCIRNKWTVSKLADYMGVKPSAITVGADRLYKRGFVSRYRSDLDRRIVYLEITDDGHEILREAENERVDSISSYLNHLSPEELGIFIDIYEKLASGNHSNQDEIVLTTQTS